MGKKIVSLLLAVVLTLGLCACGQKAATETAPTWQEQYDLGVRYLSEGNYEEAIIAFTAAIEIEPKLALAYVGRGDAYIGSGETDDTISDALSDYMIAAELDESLVNVYLKIADIYMANGERENALEWLRKGYNITENELLSERIQELEDLFLQRSDYCGYANFSSAEQEYIDSLLDVLKTEDLTAIRVFVLENGNQIGRIVENTSPNYKRLVEREGAERKIYFGTCTTYTILDSGEKMEISCRWIEDGVPCRDLNYKVEIHSQDGQGYYLYYTDYLEAYSLSFLTGQCRNWNWDGEYWRYEFDHVSFPGYATSGIYTGRYITGTASGGFVDGTETEREVSGLVIGVDNPMAQSPAVTEYTYDPYDPYLLSVGYSSHPTWWGKECENGRIVESYELESDGNKRNLRVDLYADSLLKPTGWSASAEYAEEDLW